MAKKDVREYYYSMLQQYLEMKADLEDYEQAFKDGYISEEKLAYAKEDIEKLKENYDRLSYVCYLLDMPKRKSKQEAFKKANAAVDRYLEEIGASKTAVYDENETILKHLKAELQSLTGKKDS